MKKLTIVMALIAVILTAGACGEKAKTFEKKDSTGLIGYNTTDVFTTDIEEQWEDGTRVILKGQPSDSEEKVEIIVMVSSDSIYEHTASGNADTILTYKYAENPVKESVQLFDMDGYRACYTDGSDSDHRTLDFYVFTYLPDGAAYGDMGKRINIKCTYYDDAGKACVEEMLQNNIGFDLEAYTWEMEEEKEQEQKEDSKS